MQIGMGTNSLLGRTKTGLSTSDRLKRIWDKIFLRWVWFYLNREIKTIIQQTDDATKLLSSVDSRTLSSQEYKRLRLQRDRTQQHLDQLSQVYHAPGRKVAWAHGRIGQLMAALQRNQATLDQLFAQHDLKVDSIGGFKVISQDDAWNSRTTAYDYAT
ncbi:hypothetical protein H9S92_01590 [Lewinella lacunae]|uniref:Uncharacterized protein n=1 Tax=Neolewinella lacunae TaxID=1517758 RepID=A0A923PEW4_9BACT|nr:hypothetical protein [Neolewinella lacunae]MBC6992843.1 hypothetical protein [Neolewinella lacunae]